jgi:hypothetical protein
MAVHTHGSAPPHEHANDAPGHAHDQAGNVTGPAGAGTAGTAETEHRHRGIGTHAHADAHRGHTHDDEDRRVTERAGGGLAVRVVLGVIGAVGMLVGPFLAWIDGQQGTAVQMRAFFSSEAGSGAGFVASAGFVVLVLGVLALIGLVFRSGWLTSLAAGLGLAATILVAIGQLSAGAFDALGIGWWIAAIGSLLALIASMFGATRTRVIETRESRV